MKKTKQTRRGDASRKVIVEYRRRRPAPPEIRQGPLPDMRKLDWGDARAADKT